MSPNLVLAILSHTPTWVWLLLTALLALGLSQTVPRRLPPRRIVALPGVMLVLSLVGVLTAFHGPALAAALAGWLAGGAAALFAGRRGGLATRGARWLPDEARLAVPGSWLPLVLIVALFLLKYGIAVSLAMHPQWTLDAGVAAPVGLAYGCFSGLFLARARALWATVPAAGARRAAAAGV